MQRTGHIRQVDELGRIVLPVELRQRLEIEPGDLLEVWSDTDMGALIIGRPDVNTECVFCGDMPLIDYEGLAICRDCLLGIGQAAREYSDGRLLKGRKVLKDLLNLTEAALTPEEEP